MHPAHLPVEMRAEIRCEYPQFTLVVFLLGRRLFCGEVMEQREGPHDLWMFRLLLWLSCQCYFMQANAHEGKKCEQGPAPSSSQKAALTPRLSNVISFVFYN